MLKTNVCYTSFKLSKYGQPVFTATAEYRVYSFSLNWKFCMPKIEEKKKKEKQTPLSAYTVRYIYNTYTQYTLNYSLKTVQFI